MREKRMRLPALLAAMLLAASFLPALALDGYDYTYTYNYDFWGELRESPDAYRVEKVINYRDIGLDTPMKTPQSLFVDGNELYVCDTGNNRILHLRRDGGEFSLVRVIDEVKGAEPAAFNAPYDIFVDGEGQMYVCDQNNNRIVKMDRDANYIMSFVKPTDETFTQSLTFLPSKLVVDVAGRVFALCKNVNKGLVKYEADGTFTGFIGASEARFNWYDYIWKLLSTKEQRAQQVNFVPTEYENIYLDAKGFIFATIATFEEGDVETTKPIRRINSIGSDILIRNAHNGREIPMGDLDWDDANEISGSSRLVDITVFDNGIYVALDRVRGRLFGYDTQGNMLWAFGGPGGSDGYFKRPVALEHMGYDLLALDQQECSITLFTPTDYGAMIYTASEQYLKGFYDESADTWRQVLARNGNYDLAYVGIGRALLREDQYEEAMHCFEVARDSKNYGEALRLYRKEWVEKNINWIFPLILALLVGPLLIGGVKKMRAEVNGR
ncbi:MAG: hypothetical protein IJ048_03365 [Clostridia bacterium]|nr:hypothetical protein [Clostridia bacterium]